MYLLDYLGHGLVVDFGEGAPLDAIYANGRSGLYEHNLYPLRYTHFNQVAELLLIPLHGFGVGEVQHHVLVGELSLAVAHFRDRKSVV